MIHKIVHTDCRAMFGRLARRSIDAVVTSPPYAKQRSKHYNSISEDDYPDWTVGWMNALRPVLRDSGSVAIVIRAHTRGGMVSPYVLRTRVALEEDGWCEPGELIWYKPDAAPVAPNNRPRRSWEQILWFSRKENIRSLFCDSLANGSSSTKIGSIGSRRYMRIFPDPRGRTLEAGNARCKDMVSVAVSKNHRASWNTHPAQFPTDLARWLIRLLCPEGGTVMDCFGGSGTTVEAAELESRSSIMTDTSADYVSIARRRLSEVTRLLADRKPG